MKLQYLGDSRDAFKWDLLHWICASSSRPFSELVFVPMLTPDDPESSDGQTPHRWFSCRDFIRKFVGSLKTERRNLSAIAGLGSLEPSKSFNVSLFASDKHIRPGHLRSSYWVGFQPEQHENAIVFFDPDNGFETKTQRGMKWLRHSELQTFLPRLPQSSVVVVYQHRPHRTWDALFADLKEQLQYAYAAVAVHEPNLAFIALANNADAALRIRTAIESYAYAHGVVRYTVLIDHERSGA